MLRWGGGWVMMGVGGVVVVVVMIVVVIGTIVVDVEIGIHLIQSCIGAGTGLVVETLIHGTSCGGLGTFWPFWP